MLRKKAERTTKPIVAGHLEKISSRIFDQYRQRITDLIKTHYGVYALYRRDKLYYVGLAKDLRKRIKGHLKDRHAGKWTHFSLYVLRKEEHLRELEALLLRIADPTGNYIKGKLQGSRDLRPELRVMLTEDFRTSMDEILGMRKRILKKAKKKRRRAKAKPALPLLGLLRHGQGIYATYKSKNYNAVVYHSGIIRFNGRIYDSPSAAGKALRKKETNGWRFWKYKDENGNLVPLSNLRR
jgi:hypothetical protein